MLLDNLYKAVVDQKENTTYNIEVTFANKEHPIFQAHFPNNPLLAGFLHMDILANILSKKIVKVDKAKFIQPILPNDTVTFYVQKDQNSLKTVIKNERCKYSEFTIITQ
ncbi:MAG: 3-hydroxyacyl-ACP dehydratase [Campylobacterota bacterium]|nr:3-hydroxyacyl-ACP dehydratase [Campylobacterota bacterium]